MKIKKKRTVTFRMRIANAESRDGANSDHSKPMDITLKNWCEIIPIDITLKLFCPPRVCCIENKIDERFLSDFFH